MPRPTPGAPSMTRPLRHGWDTTLPQAGVQRSETTESSSSAPPTPPPPAQTLIPPTRSLPPSAQDIPTPPPHILLTSTRVPTMSKHETAEHEQKSKAHE